MITILGAAGVIGTSMTQHFIELGYSTRTVDVVEANRAGMPIDLVVDKNWPENTKPLTEHLRESEVIINLAGSGDANWCNKHPYESLELNVRMGIAGVELGAEIGAKRVILASTCEVYGPAEIGLRYESDPCFPSTFYGASKVAMERYAVIEASNRSIEINIIRLGSAFGTHMRKTGLLNAMKRSIETGTPITVYGHQGTRQFTSLPNIAEATRLAILHEGTLPQVMNVCSSQTIEIEELLTWAETELGMPTPLRGPAKPEPASTTVSADKLFETLGFACTDDVKNYFS